MIGGADKYDRAVAVFRAPRGKIARFIVSARNGMGYHLYGVDPQFMELPGGDGGGVVVCDTAPLKFAIDSSGRVGEQGDAIRDARMHQIGGLQDSRPVRVD